MLIKRSKDGTNNTNSWYSQYHIKNSASTMNTELVKVLRFDPFIYNCKVRALCVNHGLERLK